MGQIKFVVGLLMAALFALTIVNYVTLYADDNNVAVDLGEDAELSNLGPDGDAATDLSAFKVSVNSSLKGLYETSPEEGDELLRGGGQFKLGPGNAYSTIKNIISVGFTKIFGQDTDFGILLTAFISTLGFILGLYLWKAWKGNPD